MRRALRLPLAHRPEYDRETDEETLYTSSSVPLGTAQRSVDIEVPAAMPFTHQGNCISYLWKAIVRERP